MSDIHPAIRAGISPRAIVSDVGGIFTEDTWKIVSELLSVETKLPKEQIERSFRGHYRSFDLGETSLTDFMTKVSAELRLGIPPVRLSQLVLGDGLKIIPENVELLRRVREVARVRTVGVSNVGREIAYTLQQRFSLYDIFDATILSYEIRELKPARKMFLSALRAARCAPRECLFLDDTTSNVRAGLRAGMLAETVSSPPRLGEILRRHFPGIGGETGGTAA